MYLTFEISTPFLVKPGYYKSSLTRRVYWLWFAIGYHPMREDELHDIIRSGVTQWGGK